MKIIGRGPIIANEINNTCVSISMPRVKSTHLLDRVLDERTV